MKSAVWFVLFFFGVIIANAAEAQERFYDVHLKLPTNENVESVAFSPDGSLIVAGAGYENGEIYVWDRHTGEVLHVLKVDSRGVRSVAFSPDGERLVSVGGMVEVWAIKSGKRIAEIKPESVGAFRAVFSRDGKSVVVVGQQAYAGLYDSSTGKQQRLFRPQSGETLVALDVTSDGSGVMVGGRWHAVSLFHMGSDQLSYAHVAHGGIIRALAAVPNSNAYLSGGDDNAVRLWEIGLVNPSKQFTGHNRWTTSISVSGDGKRFVSGGRGAAYLWDIDTTTLLGQLRDAVGFTGDAAFSPDGELVAVGTLDGVALFKVDNAPDVGADARVGLANAETVTPAEEAVASQKPAEPEPEMVLKASTKAEPAIVGGEGDNLANKHALVFGLAKYSVDPLDNAENDANDIASSLERIGFKVKVHLNTDLAAMRLALAEFESGLPDGAVALVFFAGHAVQFEGNSYLLPIGSIANIETSKDLQRLALSLSDLVSPLSTRKDAISIFILDACRNSPFASIPEIGSGLSRGTPVRGMTDIPLGGEASKPSAMGSIAGSLIAYSTSPDTVAEDGSGRNSPYTKHLKEELLKPNTSIEDVLKATRLGVTKDTKGRQTPWYESSISGGFYPAGRNRIEFADLIRLFVPVDDWFDRDENGSYGYDWSMGSENNSPVAWLHGGREEAEKRYLHNSWGEEAWTHHYQRRGEVVITVNGKPSYNVLDKKEQPGKWEITMLGLRGGVELVSFDTDAYSDRIPLPNFVVEQSECTRDFGFTGGFYVYRIKLPGHVPAWLGEWYSCGTVGCAASYSIVYSRKDTQKMGCP